MKRVWTAIRIICSLWCVIVLAVMVKMPNIMVYNWGKLIRVNRDQFMALFIGLIGYALASFISES